MTVFIRLASELNKGDGLRRTCASIRSGAVPDEVYFAESKSFREVPGSPLAYWISDDVRAYFSRGIPFARNGRLASVGASTKDNFRYTRSWVEVLHTDVASSRKETADRRWAPFAMGGKVSPYYRDISLVINWQDDGRELKAAISEYRGSRGWGYQWSAALNGHDYYFSPGVTWPLRAGRFAPQAMPSGCIFSGRGYAAFSPDDQRLAMLAIFNSCAFDFLFKVALGRFGHPEFLVGILSSVPYVEPDEETLERLNGLAARAWRLRQVLDTVNEYSHAFLLPETLLPRSRNEDLAKCVGELASIQAEVDEIVFDLYGFTASDRTSMFVSVTSGQDFESGGDTADEDDDEQEDEDTAAQTEALLSWAVGVAFGRFDWRLATGERAAPPNSEPFAPLPSKSPGMLPDQAAPFHTNAGILVDDRGHSYDLVTVIEEVLVQVDAAVPSELRHWVRRDFFPFHFHHYSKSRRKAPIYWPLSTSSGSYTLWLYYPSLNSQTLYTAINDFVEPKLKRVGDDLASLRNKGSSRSRDDEKQFEALQSLESELLELYDKLQEIASVYKPNHDDGVQIIAAPLWPLFRHKPWQKVLKDTWAKLEKGEYDWAHMAMAYWPDRVREKCKTDKSLAIAHGLEDLYVEPEAAPKKTRGRKKAA